MAYSTNPFLPRVRMAAVLKVRDGWPVRRTARYFGISPGTVSKWTARAPRDGRIGIPTKSSRPHISPNRIDLAVEQMIIEERRRSKRCGQVIHHELTKRGVSVGLSTVHRVLKRHYLIKERDGRKPKWIITPRPEILIPGDLVELDTVHKTWQVEPKLYVYALIDVFSRWAFAWATERINVLGSLRFVREAQRTASFRFHMLQTDHGSEFSRTFTIRVRVPHRHSRLRKPNDQGHVERFNRTLQEEALRGVPKRVESYNRVLAHWLRYYNEERPHMGIGFLTPAEKIRQVFPSS